MPTTSKPSTDPSSIASPSRNTGWSSATVDPHRQAGRHPGRLLAHRTQQADVVEGRRAACRTTSDSGLSSRAGSDWAPVTVPVFVAVGGTVALVVAIGHLLVGYLALGLILALRPELTRR